MKILLTYIRSLNDFRLIPEKLKEDMKLNKLEILSKTLINVTAEQEGTKGVEEFRYTHVSVCRKK